MIDLKQTLFMSSWRSYILVKQRQNTYFFLFFFLVTHLWTWNGQVISYTSHGHIMQIPRHIYSFWKQSIFWEKCSIPYEECFSFTTLPCKTLQLPLMVGRNKRNNWLNISPNWFAHVYFSQYVNNTFPPGLNDYPKNSFQWKGAIMPSSAFSPS